MRRTFLLLALLGCAGHGDVQRDTVRTASARPVDTATSPNPSGPAVSPPLVPSAPRADGASSMPFDMGPVPPGISLPQDTLQFDPAGRPKLPYIDRDACESDECVTRFRVVACQPTTLRSAPSETASSAVTVAAGDTLRVWQTDVVVRSAGMVVLARDTMLEDVRRWHGDSIPPSGEPMSLKRGDTLFVLDPRGGLERWIRKGTAFVSLAFWRESERRAKPVTEDWWRIQTASGATGWWRLSDSMQPPLYPIDDIVSAYRDCRPDIR